MIGSIRKGWGLFEKRSYFSAIQALNPVSAIWRWAGGLDLGLDENVLKTFCFPTNDGARWAIYFYDADPRAGERLSPNGVAYRSTRERPM